MIAETVRISTEQRQHERFPIMMSAGVSIGDGEFEAVIFDISAGGAKVQIKGSFGYPDSETMKAATLNIPVFGEFSGELAWTDGEFIGIRFDESHKSMVGLILDAGTAS